jgi:hypothetical protein
MTSLTTSPRIIPATGPTRHLVAVLLLGLLIAATATVLLLSGGDVRQGTPAGGSGATTDASTQYADWYTRPSSLMGSTSAGEQYRAWFTRGEEPVDRGD